MKIKIKNWCDMVNEYGTNEFGDIDTPIKFSEFMKYLCGNTYEAEKTENGYYYITDEYLCIDPNCVIEEPNYWERICEMQRKQTEKGLKTYGQTLEQNTELNMKIRLTMLEEEMIDSLMYIEHIKEMFNHD